MKKIYVFFAVGVIFSSSLGAIANAQSVSLKDLVTQYARIRFEYRETGYPLDEVLRQSLTASSCNASSLNDIEKKWCYEMIAIAYENPSICNNSADPEDCRLRYALTRPAPDGCAGISDSLKQNDCYTTHFYYQDPTLVDCATYPQADLKEACTYRKEVFSEYLHLCPVHPDGPENYRRCLISYILPALSDDAICKYEFGDANKNECYNSYVQSRVKAEGSNTSVIESCLHINESNPLLTDLAQRNCILNIAAEYKLSPKACDVLNNQETRDSCWRATLGYEPWNRHPLIPLGVLMVGAIGGVVFTMRRFMNSRRTRLVFYFSYLFLFFLSISFSGQFFSWGLFLRLFSFAPVYALYQIPVSGGALIYSQHLLFPILGPLKATLIAVLFTTWFASRYLRKGGENKFLLFLLFPLCGIIINLIISFVLALVIPGAIPDFG